MKKLFLVFFALASVAFAADGETLLSYSAIAAGVGLGIAALGCAIGM